MAHYYYKLVTVTQRLGSAGQDRSLTETSVCNGMSITEEKGMIDMVCTRSKEKF